MKKINIRKLSYHVRHTYLTMNNIVIGVALLIGASWAWGSVGVMQRNYTLQKEIDSKNREATLADLEVQNAKFEVKYHQSNEYKELAVRDRLGLADPGEKVLFLPPNTAAAKNADAEVAKKPASSTVIAPAGNVQQWMNFLFGGNREGLHK
jgi:hypothetical protein